MKTNKLKMSLLVWSAMFPFSTAVHYGLAQLPFTAHWPIVARTFCLTCLLVPYMVCVALPFLNRRFKNWLQTDSPNISTQVEQNLLNQSDKIQSETSSVSRQYYALS